MFTQQNVDFSRKYTFQLLNKTKTTAFNKRSSIIPYPRVYSIPLVDNILDVKTKQQKTIRVIDGEVSIVALEQSLPVNTSNISSYIKRVKFVDGFLTLDPNTQLNEILFMMNSEYRDVNRRGSKKCIFKEYNIEEIAKKGLESKSIMKKAMDKFTELLETEDIDKIVAISRAFGINTNRPITVVSYDLSNFVNANPSLFLDKYEDPKTEVRSNVLTAIDKGVLFVNINSNSINWSQPYGGGVIATVGQGKSPVEYLVEMLLDVEYTALYSDILKHIGMKSKTETEKRKTTKV